jgi:hypothetical protein
MRDDVYESHPPADPWVERLTRVVEHPVWRGVGRLLDPRMSSTVSFTHRPGESWRLERRGDRTVLLPGAAPDPDFLLRFTPAAVDRLAALHGSAGDFVAELLALASASDPELRIDIQVAVRFARLLSRGYVRLLLAAAPHMRAIGFAHGESGVSSLQQLATAMRRLDAEDAEAGASGPQTGTPAAGSRARRARSAPRVRHIA